MMIGLGFKPLEAAKLALIGNTAPVAFGSLGIPLTTLATVTGLDVNALSSMVGFHLTIFSFIVPFWLIAAQVGWRGMVEVWPPASSAAQPSVRCSFSCRISTARNWWTSPPGSWR